MPGMVLLNIVGPPLGKTAVVPETFPEWNCNQAIAFFRFISDVLPEYIHAYFRAGLFLKNIDLIGTAGQDNISVTKCKNIVIPLPPLAEQRRIVGKVDQLLGLCDELAARQAARREARSALVRATLDRLVSPRRQPNSSSPSPHNFLCVLMFTNIPQTILLLFLPIFLTQLLTNILYPVVWALKPIFEF